MSRYKKELDKICKKNGRLTAPDVVEAARPIKSPLHPAFEWDDPVAAEQYRLYQARQLIRTVTVVREQTCNESGKIVSVKSPAYSHCPNPGEKQGAYYPTEVVVARPDLYAMALKELKTKLSSAQKSLDDLKSAAVNSDASELTRERVAMITIAIEALKTAGNAVSSLH